ncbi:hypothetical protein CPB85DRAFT_1357620, partial [Mucidula mucida]
HFLRDSYPNIFLLFIRVDGADATPRHLPRDRPGILACSFTNIMTIRAHRVLFSSQGLAKAGINQNMNTPPAPLLSIYFASMKDPDLDNGTDASRPSAHLFSSRGTSRGFNVISLFLGLTKTLHISHADSTAAGEIMIRADIHLHVLVPVTICTQQHPILWAGSAV